MRNEFLSRQPISYPTQGDKVYRVTSGPGRSGLAGVIEGRLIHFDVLYLVGILDYLTSLFEEGFEYNTIVVHSSTISAYQLDDMLLWANIL